MSPPILAHHHHQHHQQPNANGLQPAAMSAIKAGAIVKNAGAVYSTAPVAMAISATSPGPAGGGGGGASGGPSASASVASTQYYCNPNYTSGAPASPPGVAVSTAEHSLLTQAGSYSKRKTLPNIASLPTTYLHPH